MSINSEPGHIWAVNYGDNGRPSGVGPVIIDNLEELIPSGSGGHTYTGGNGIDVDNVNDTISLDSETEAAINSYVTNSGSFLTSDDLNGYATENWVENKNYITSADVPEIKDLVAGNGIDITTTSADVTISVDNTIFNGYATETWTAQNYFPIDGIQIVSSSAEASGANIIYIVTGSEPGPVDLPPFTIRCKFSSGYTPTEGDSQTLVDSGENVWDITKNSTDWDDLLIFKSELLEVQGANTTGVTSMSQMFAYCSSITSVPLFDTSSCTDMSSMFEGCTSLTTVPLFDTSSCNRMASMFNGCTSLTTVPTFDTSSCTNMASMFNTCTALTAVPLFDTSSCENMNVMFNSCGNVESGALALYQQASTQANPPYNHNNTFTDCGINTVTGTAELAQIPSDWGGTGA